MNSRRCDKAGIVYLKAQNTIFHNQSSRLKIAALPPSSKPKYFSIKRSVPSDAPGGPAELDYPDGKPHT